MTYSKIYCMTSRNVVKVICIVNDEQFRRKVKSTSVEFLRHVTPSNGLIDAVNIAITCNASSSFENAFNTTLTGRFNFSVRIISD